MISFRDFLFKKLPRYFWDNDTYKDNIYEPGKGLLQRFMETLGLEIDEGSTPYIDNIGYIWDPESLGLLPEGGNWELLKNLGDILGSPPDAFLTSQGYGNLLKQILKIYQVKGSQLGYERYFMLLGYYVQIKLANSASNKYDVGNKYDDGFKYDTFTRVPFQIDLILSNIYSQAPPSQERLDLLKASAEFITPINVQIRNITYINNNNFRYVIYNGQPVIYDGQLVTMIQEP